MEAVRNRPSRSGPCDEINELDGMEAWRLFWAKTDRRRDEHGELINPEWSRPLWAHLLDVTSAADLLWQCYLSVPLRRRFTEATGLEEAEARRVLSLWLGLHDVGKAIPGFQPLHEPSWELLREAGFDRPSAADEPFHHGHATIPLLWRWIRAADFEAKTARFLRRAAMFVGFHHGRLCTRSHASNNDLKLGTGLWKEAQQGLITAVVEAWNPVWPDAPDVPRRQWPSWLLGFAGWVTLADWIGSMAEYYPREVDAGDDLASYLPRGREGAARAIEAIGIARTAALQDGSFRDLFGFETPRPLQARTRHLDCEDGPTLTIIEGPTGVGKTEGALWLTARQQAQEEGGGAYVAMPTQATSNGLFPRFERYLERAHAAGEAANLTLLHGTADLHPDRQRLLSASPSFNDIAEREGGSRRAEVYTQAWFLPKKRGLLAPYGVGTVDQTFLGVLFSKHFFLRLFGLSGKTVIFDEVHAYDTYMNELFGRLLGWLRALGTNVILLSATLPSTTRARLVEAWGGTLPDRTVGYPSILHVTASETSVEDGFEPPASSKHTRLRWMQPDIGAVCERVREAVEAGATVAVIVNRVSRAQEIFRRLVKEGRLGLPDDDIHLLHSRFPLGQRAEREEAVLERFGPGRPSRPGVLVSTQVAEQSLDLDFDLMLSDLAPVDLLLQRDGRLHRFLRDRPEGFEAPCLWVLCPEAEDGAFPDVQDVGIVYDRLILYRTWHLLQGRSGWKLPEDYRPLVEGVYASKMPEDLTEEQRAQWKEAEVELERRSRTEAAEAKKRLIPSHDTLKELANLPHLIRAEEDEENVHADLRALTRLTEPSVEAVCLHRDADGALFLDAGHQRPASVDAPLQADDERALLETSIRISHRVLAPFLLEREPPQWWSDLAEETPALYRHRLLVFEDGCWKEHERYGLRLDESLGLVIN